MKRLLLAFLAFFCLLEFTACGYNSIMYHHLSDPDSYQTVTVRITKIDMPENARYVYFHVSFEDYDIAERFSGYTIDRNQPLEQYDNVLQIMQKSNEKLQENGFYDAFELGDAVELVASAWIYMDGNFFYVAAVSYRETEYLAFDDGLADIIDVMKRRRSLL